MTLAFFLINAKILQENVRRSNKSRRVLRMLKKWVLYWFRFEQILQIWQVKLQLLSMSQLQETGLKNYKTIIIGRSAVGKSTLLIRYVDGEFNPQKPTIGIDYRFKKVTHQDATFNLQLWDSAGQQRYRTIVYNYFTLSKAGVIVFDLTNEDSLSDAKNWLQQLVNHCGNQIPKILLGNKSDLLTPVDLEQKRQKYRARIDQLKQEFKCEYFEVSAKTGERLADAFGYLIAQIYAQNKASQPEPTKPPGFKLKSTIVDQNKQQAKKKDKCC